jgi:hypothetical protein
MVKDTCLVALKRKDQNPCILRLGNHRILDRCFGTNSPKRKHTIAQMQQS